MAICFDGVRRREMTPAELRKLADELHEELESSEIRWGEKILATLLKVQEETRRECYDAISMMSCGCAHKIFSLLESGKEKR
jgi:hypothetical protein